MKIIRDGSNILTKLQFKLLKFLLVDGDLVFKDYDQDYRLLANIFRKSGLGQLVEVLESYGKPGPQARLRLISENQEPYRPANFKNLVQECLKALAPSDLDLDGLDYLENILFLLGYGLDYQSSLGDGGQTLLREDYRIYPLGPDGSRLPDLFELLDSRGLDSRPLDLLLDRILDLDYGPGLDQLMAIFHQAFSPAYLGEILGLDGGGLEDLEELLDQGQPVADTSQAYIARLVLAYYQELAGLKASINSKDYASYSQELGPIIRSNLFFYLGLLAQLIFWQADYRPQEGPLEEAESPQEEIVVARLAQALSYFQPLVLARLDLAKLLKSLNEPGLLASYREELAYKNKDREALEYGLGQLLWSFYSSSQKLKFDYFLSSYIQAIAGLAFTSEDLPASYPRQISSHFRELLLALEPLGYSIDYEKGDFLLELGGETSSHYGLTRLSLVKSKPRTQVEVNSYLEASLQDYDPNSLILYQKLLGAYRAGDFLDFKGLAQDIFAGFFMDPSGAGIKSEEVYGYSYLVYGGQAPGYQVLNPSYRGNYRLIASYSLLVNKLLNRETQARDLLLSLRLLELILTWNFHKLHRRIEKGS